MSVSVERVRTRLTQREADERAADGARVARRHGLDLSSLSLPEVDDLMWLLASRFNDTDQPPSYAAHVYGQGTAMVAAAAQYAATEAGQMRGWRL